MKLENGDRVYDKDMDVYGTVRRSDDIHNILVEYDNGIGGLYCLEPSCIDYDKSLKLIK